MGKETLLPDFILESSWEVCNEVGGIYTVLSTRARTLKDTMKDNIIFIGPDRGRDNDYPYFNEDENLYGDWRRQAHGEGLDVRIGRWDVNGSPIAVLVDFKPFYGLKDDIYARAWELFGVDSLHAYGDYDEASMFSYAAGRVVESFYKHNMIPTKKVIYHGNEWMTGLGLLYVAHKLPQVATIFTTHATSIGRSIAGNNKPLYDYFNGYNGDQMACELNMQSKHSIEKQTAKYVDCFTTVSDITARECEQLLDKPVDYVLPNGFDNDIVPTETTFNKKRKVARKRLIRVANALTGIKYDEKETFIVSISGRYEFRNKGIDVFIDAMSGLRNDVRLNKKVIAYLEIPAWMDKPREDLVNRLANNIMYDTPLEQPYITHWLHDMNEDKTLNMFKSLNVRNLSDDNVTLIFVPCYLTGNDGVMNIKYYDLLLGNDLCVYPSYYEPWGYTPLEAIAFKVPCVTTDLSGFGLWVNSVKHGYSEIEDGVKVVHRNDSNYPEVVSATKETVEKVSNFSATEAKSACDNAVALSQKAIWGEFIKYYYNAYDFALHKASQRSGNKNRTK